MFDLTAPEWKGKLGVAPTNGSLQAFVTAVRLSEDPDAPIENLYLPGDDPGALVSAAGEAILDGAEHPDEEEQLVDLLLSEAGQGFYAEAAAEADYALRLLNEVGFTT